MLFSGELARRLRGPHTHTQICTHIYTDMHTHTQSHTYTHRSPDLQGVVPRYGCVVLLSPPRSDPDRAGPPRLRLVPSAGGAAEPPVPAADEDPHPGQPDLTPLRPHLGPGGPLWTLLQVRRRVWERAKPHPHSLSLLSLQRLCRDGDKSRGTGCGSSGETVGGERSAGWTDVTEALSQSQASICSPVEQSMMSSEEERRWRT